ncbi:MAG: hypothetical protein ACUVQY_01475 [Thermoproteota archaeon]
MSIKLTSSIKEWENLTLYSGGGVPWGKCISYESGKEARESKLVRIVIPDYVKELKLDVIGAEVEVRYVYAQPIGMEFTNLFDKDIVPIEISLVRPGPPAELIAMIVMVVLPIGVALLIRRNTRRRFLGRR